MTITGFKSTDISSRGKVEPATVSPQGYKRMGLDVNAIITQQSLGTFTVTGVSSTNQITVSGSLANVIVGDLLGWSGQVGSATEIVNISGQTITVARDLPNLSASGVVAITRLGRLAVGANGEITITSAPLSSINTILSNVVLATDGSASSVPYGLVLGGLDINAGWVVPILTLNSGLMVAMHDGVGGQLGTSGSPMYTYANPYTVAATVPAYGEIVGTSLTGSYATLLTMGGNAKGLTLMNSCDQAVIISFDGGTTNNIKLDAFESWTKDYVANNLYLTSGTIQAKHAGTVPKVGSIRAWIER